MAVRVRFTGKDQVDLEAFEPGGPKDEQVSLRTLYTLMSTGTEGIVLRRDFDPGTHFDRWVRYPFYPGYLAVGAVEQAGPGVLGLERGAVVFTRGTHASHHVVAAARCTRVPPGLDPREATWCGLAKIAFRGAHAAGFGLGTRVAIIGAGPIGQMALRWARAAGAERVVVIDSFARRLELARRGGATHAIAARIEDARDALRAANDGRDLPLVIDTTGNAAVLPHALRLCARFGTLILLGDTGHPEAQHLTSDVIAKGLTIVGVHDLHDRDGWDEPRIQQLFFELAASGRFDLTGLLTHAFRPAQCAEAYTLASERRGETLGILFDWTDATERPPVEGAGG